jgi:hypothetical protein
MRNSMALGVVVRRIPAQCQCFGVQPESAPKSSLVCCQVLLVALSYSRSQVQYSTDDNLENCEAYRKLEPLKVRHRHESATTKSKHSSHSV